MSISSEISRIKTAKSDIITAIQSKGVAVENDAKIETLPEAINSISANGITVNGSKKIRTNNVGLASAGNAVAIADRVIKGEFKTDATHMFNEYTCMLRMQTEHKAMSDYKLIISPYAYGETDYGYLVEYCYLNGNYYRPINKFITPILFTDVTSTTIKYIKQVNPAVLSETRVVLGLSLNTTGDIRILVFDFDNVGAPTTMNILDRTFNFSTNVNPWFTRVAAGTARYQAHSIVTAINDSKFMIPLPYSTASDNKTLGIVVFSISSNGAISIIS